MTEEIYFKRQENLKNVLSEHDLDGLLITNLTNIRYISQKIKLKDLIDL